MGIENAILNVLTIHIIVMGQLCVCVSIYGTACTCTVHVGRSDGSLCSR